MALSLSQILQRLWGADRKTLIVGVGILVVAVYLALQGVQYVNETGRAAQLRTEAQELSQIISGFAAPSPQALSTLASEETHLAEEQSRFSYTTDDELLRLLSETAREWRVRVESAATRSGGSTADEVLIYRVVRIDLRISGQATRLLGYVGALATAIPGLGVNTVRMGGFGQDPWATLELILLLDPVRTGGADT